MQLHVNLFPPHRFAIFSVTVLLSLGLLGGCANTATPYATPSVEIPAQWPHHAAALAHSTELANTPQQADAMSVKTPGWWQAFNDAALNQLIRQAVAHNADLAAATIRVRRAQLQAGLAQDNLTPSLNASGNTSVQRRLESDASTSRSSSVSLGISYEVDLWNKLGSQLDAARWSALATEQDRRSTAYSLAATTATLYWQLGLLNQRLAVAQASLAYAETTQKLIAAKYKTGAVSSLEVAQTQQNVNAQQAALSQLLQQHTEATQALDLLFDGQLPRIQAALEKQGNVLEPTTLSSYPLPEIQANLPASLLVNRPDLRAAELRLRTNLANLDAERANYYPAITLTGSLGSASSSLTEVLKNPVAALGAGLVLPFLQHTQRKLNQQISQTQYEEAVVNFRKSWYQALSEVNNALSALQRSREQASLLNQSLVAAREIERLNEIRFRAGATALQLWLDAQDKRRSAEMAVAENSFTQLSQYAKLQLALGSGGGLD